MISPSEAKNVFAPLHFVSVTMSTADAR